MKNIFYFILAFTFIMTGCKNDKLLDSTKMETVTFPEKIASATIYEVNIRQHTPEGTISAFIKDLPRLKELGVKMLWIMPVQPIGVLNRKGDLGSYYSIKDYKSINPEFGNMDDFKNLVKTCHEMGFYIILDWVPNHTAWDHPWITSNPEYYAKDSQGNITYEADWNDIALLDHTNPEIRKAMIEEMKYWVTETDIDGFRCDHAGHEIPLYFWEEATEELDKMKDLFWLAEWDEARMHLEFDATYSWELLHLTEEVAEGKKNANDIEAFIDKDLKEYGRKAFRMAMITNHDENAWSGTVFERYGDGNRCFAAFIFSAYGIPLIYSGQEAGMDKRLKFFYKDTINWSDPNNFQDFYKKLVSLKSDNPALWNGEYGGVTKRINKDEKIYAFKRDLGTNQVIGIMNFSSVAQELNITDPAVAGSYTDYFTQKSYELNPDKALELQPWQYLIFTKK